MNNTNLTALVLILLSFLNWACSSGGSESSANGDGNNQQNDASPMSGNETQQSNILIQGFWNISYTDDAGQLNEAYVEVKPDGAVTNFNHDQNDMNAGGNCFTIETSQLSSLGSNRYRQTNLSDGSFDEFTATVNGNTLTVSYVDVEDDNNNGDRTDIITESFPMAVGIAAVDLVLCDASDSQDPISNQGTGEPITGADGILGHPPAEYIGTWTYRSITIDQSPTDLASHLGFANGAVEARLHIMTNSAYVYEEVDARGGQVWAEWGFIYFNDGVFDVNRQFNTSGPAEQMTVVNHQLVDGTLFLQETINGQMAVYVLRQLN